MKQTDGINTLRTFIKLHEHCQANNYRPLIEYKDAGFNLEAEGNSLLKTAIKHGSLNVVEVLLYWVNPNLATDFDLKYKRTNRGGSPLFHAVRKGFYNLTETLLKNGARIEAITDEEWLIISNENNVFDLEIRRLLHSYQIAQNN